MVILGYIARYYVLSSRIILTQLYLIPRSMEEAAEISGAAWPARMIHILVPLAKRGIAAAWLCTFIFCLRDTDLTMLVYPPGLETLPVRIFTLMANGTPELIASLCMLMVVVVTIPATILWSLKWTK
jgi:iron(III) transport system permease protein